VITRRHPADNPHPASVPTSYLRRNRTVGIPYPYRRSALHLPKWLLGPRFALANRAVYEAVSLTHSGLETASQAEYTGSIPVIGSTVIGSRSEVRKRCSMVFENTRQRRDGDTTRSKVLPTRGLARHCTHSVAFAAASEPFMMLPRPRSGSLGSSNTLIKSPASWLLGDPHSQVVAVGTVTVLHHGRPS
jgi:hypothetical protein